MRIRFQIITLALVAAALAAIGTLLAQPLAAPTISPTTAASPSTMRVATAWGELSTNYTSVAELAKAADLIVVGRVAASTSRPFGRLAFTLSTIEVTSTVKGAASAQVRVLETGGVLPPGPAKNGATTATAVDMAFEGVPAMRPGQSTVLFLQRYVGPIASDTYVILGSFQGKFQISDDRIAPNTVSGALDRPEFAVLASVKGRTVAELIADVRAALR